jgi:prolyl-tRNA editing enzyme YbaK/EbsC (Cys-tRNA(Pro) deacylase)
MCGAELHALPNGVQRVAAFLQQNGHAHLPVMLDGAARTAQQAADALGVELGQIGKSIVFRRKVDDVAVMVVTSGDQRVDERKVEALVCPDGKRLGRADAEFVKAKTGFSIGGVAPVAHASPVVVLIDKSLLRFDEVWAAAGHPHAVFRLTAEELVLLSGAPIVDTALISVVTP